MVRVDGRDRNDMRPLELQLGAMKYPEGSCLVTLGDTKVLCSATVEERVPQWMMGTGEGWITAEYGMLPRSTQERRERDAARGRQDARGLEIQRLIGRSLRAVTDLHGLGERTVVVDCDVLQADGGTRTAAVTGACVALAQAMKLLVDERKIKRVPLRDLVAGVSVGVVAGEKLLDLCYEEDYRAAVDMNIIMSGRENIVEIQGTAEGAPFPRTTLNELIDLAILGIRQVVAAQRKALAGVVAL